MSVKSFQQRQNMIDAATDTSTGQVGWEGENGIESILSELNDAIRSNGIIFYPDTNALSFAGQIDSGYAACINGTLLAFYKWFAEIDPSYTGAITSSAGGQWRPFFGINTATGPWTVNGSNDIIPDTIYLDSGVAIGKNTVTVGLWMDFASVGADTKGRGVRLPVLSTAQANLKTLVNNELFCNSEDRMLLRYDSVAGDTKSAGVLSFTQQLSPNGSTATFTITLPYGASMHVNSFKVSAPTALNTASATALKLGYYITNKTTNSFDLVFQSNPAAGTLNYDLTISH